MSNPVTENQTAGAAGTQSEPPLKQVEYELKHPITVGAMVVTKFVINRPKAGHLRKMPADSRYQTVGHMLDIIGSMAGQTPLVMDQVDQEDLDELEKVLDRFLPNAQKTGQR